MNPENEIDKMPRRAESPSVEKVSAWLAALIILLGLFLYAKYWKEKSDAKTCVMYIRNFQTGARSFAGIHPEIAGPSTSVDDHTVYTFMSITPYECPAGGSYTVHGHYFDTPGTVFLRCSHPNHAPTPAQVANW